MKFLLMRCLAKKGGETVMCLPVLHYVLTPKPVRVKASMLEVKQQELLAEAQKLHDIQVVSYGWDIVDNLLSKSYAFRYRLIGDTKWRYLHTDGPQQNPFFVA